MFSDQTFSSAVDQEAAVGGTNLTYRQMSPGPFHGRIRRLSLPGVEIVREESSRRLEIGFALAPDTVFVELHRPPSGGSRIEDVTAGPGMGGYATGPRHLSELTEEGYDATQVTLRGAPANALAALAQAGWTLFDPTGGAAVRDMTLWLDGILWHASGAGPAPSAQLLAMVPGLVLDRLSLLIGPDATRPARRGNRSRLYARIRDWLADHADDAICVQDVAASFDVPARELRSACREVAGQSLDELLRIHRLNLAHRDLVLARDRPARVTDIAMDHGFVHLGRFAEQYRRFFGETPSQTLRRA